MNIDLNNKKEIISLYSEDDIKIMKLAEQSRLRNGSRIDEIMNFAKNSNYEKIGIASCAAFIKEMNQLEEILIVNGFTVLKTNCKVGKITSDSLIGSGKGITCNPVLQAKLLEEEKSDFNIVMGLCIGHDVLFSKNSKTPQTTLIVKDRKFKNCSINSFK